MALRLKLSPSPSARFTAEMVLGRARVAGGGALAALILAVVGAGCGAESHPNEPRPAVPDPGQRDDRQSRHRGPAAGDRHGARKAPAAAAEPGPPAAERSRPRRRSTSSSSPPTRPARTAKLVDQRPEASATSPTITAEQPRAPSPAELPDRQLHDHRQPARRPGDPQGRPLPRLLQERPAAAVVGAGADDWAGGGPSQASPGEGRLGGGPGRLWPPRDGRVRMEPES